LIYYFNRVGELSLLWRAFPFFNGLWESLAFPTERFFEGKVGAAVVEECHLALTEPCQSALKSTFDLERV